MPNLLRLLTITACLSLHAINTFAQVRLVADLNDDYESPIRWTKQPMQHVAAESRLFFVVWDYNSGYELWTSDGAEEGTVLLKSFVRINEIQPIGDILLFSAVTDEHGFELWKSDGTPSGTVMVKDIYPGAGSSSPSYMTNVNGTLFFSANNKFQGRELWRSDGTAAGTSMVRDVMPGPLSSNVRKIVAFDSSVVFVANDGFRGYELWISDGTSGGTRLVDDILNTPGKSSAPDGLTVANGLVFFSATSKNFDRQLFKSDGTKQGTSIVKVIKTGGSAHIDKITAVGDLVFFEADDGVHGKELWRSNGTAAGTFLVKDITPGPESQTLSDGNHLYQLTGINGKLFFLAPPNETSLDLWVSDGTQAGTTILVPGSQLNVLSSVGFADLNGEAIFVVRDRSTLTDFLYRSDGTTVSRIVELPGGISHFVGLDNKLYFFTHEHYAMTDGTAEGTVPVMSIRSAPGVLLTYMADLNGTLLFALEDFAPAGFWRTNGTEESTKKLKDVFVNTDILVYDSLAFFGGNLRQPPYSSGPWRSDGTEAGTFLLSETADNAYGFTEMNGWIFFGGGSNPNSYLFKTDGTIEGTTELNSSTPFVDPGWLTSVNNALYFFAFTPEWGTELWTSDGTEAGTQLVKDTQPGESGLSVRSTIAFGNRLYFQADDGVHGLELWTSDGTPGGTYMVSDIRSGPFDFGDMRPLTATSNTLFMPALNASGKVSLFKVNPTSLVSLHDFEISAVEKINILGAMSGQILFLVSGGDHTQLWRSNGTVRGTVMLKRFRGLSVPGGSGAVRDGVMYFGHANTIWRSDGTSQGTYSLPFNGTGWLFTTAGPYVYFESAPFEHGRELFLIEPEQTSASSVETARVLEEKGPRDGISGYPNPFRSVFNIRVGGEVNESFDVKVYDLQGSTVFQQSQLPCNTNHSLGASWKNGLYMVRIKQGDQIILRRVAKSGGGN